MGDPCRFCRVKPGLLRFTRSDVNYTYADNHRGHNVGSKPSVSAPRLILF